MSEPSSLAARSPPRVLQEPAPISPPSPTPAATTPAESQIEREMRLDYEAAEKAYRATVAEQDRLAQLVAPRRPRLQLERRRRGLSSDFSLRSLRRIA